MLTSVASVVGIDARYICLHLNGEDFSGTDC
jgi:hypothetical protein